MCLRFQFCIYPRVCVLWYLYWIFSIKFFLLLIGIFLNFERKCARNGSKKLRGSQLYTKLQWFLNLRNWPMGGETYTLWSTKTIYTEFFLCICVWKVIIKLQQLYSILPGLWVMLQFRLIVCAISSLHSPRALW